MLYSGLNMMTKRMKSKHQEEEEEAAEVDAEAVVANKVSMVDFR